MNDRRRMPSDGKSSTCLWEGELKKGALDSQPQVIKFTSCFPMVGGTPAFSTTKTGRHDIAEILLKVALNTINQPTNQ